MQLCQERELSRTRKIDRVIEKVCVSEVDARYYRFWREQRHGVDYFMSMDNGEIRSEAVKLTSCIHRLRRLSEGAHSR